MEEPKVERITMWQQLEKLGELMEHYFFKLPRHIGVPKMLDKAAELERCFMDPLNCAEMSPY